ncbi:MAG TPA: long-chain-acyl-CoA synthetase [Bdellovibrionota bacterium]|nr:long-chain-acyl-CoA synthetase [Bdellovibrionota bacterium]
MSDRLKISGLLRGFLEFAPKVPGAIWKIKSYLALKDDSHHTLGWQLEQNAEKYPDSPALFYEDRVWSHRELNEITNRYGRFFLASGITKGDIVAVYVENKPELIFLVGALAKIGAVAALVNPKLSGASLKHSFQVEKYRSLVVDAELAEPFAEIASGLELPSGRSFWLGAGAMPAAFRAFDKLEALDAANLPERERVTIKDPYALVFTSGTTGLPKASVQSNRRWFGAMTWFGKIVLRLGPADRVYIPLPFCHTNALQVGWAPTAGAGAAIVMRKKFSASKFWDDISRYNVTHFVYIGELCRYLVKQVDHPLQKKHSVRAIFGNGLRPEIWDEFKRRFAIPRVYEFYGAAEAPLLFTNVLNLDKTVGICMTPYAIVAYDFDKQEIERGAEGFCRSVGVGESGILLARIDPQTPFSGYTNKAETEKKLLRDVFRKGDLFFNSGDLVKKLGFGHVAFADRLGDTFRWKGENVATTEVEKVANAYAGVKESCCYGVAVPGHDGKVGMIAIVPQSTSFDAEAFFAHLASELPEYAVPRFLRSCEVFETTATHKIKKTTLQQQGLSFASHAEPLHWYTPRTTKVDVHTAAPSEADLKRLS